MASDKEELILLSQGFGFHASFCHPQLRLVPSFFSLIAPFPVIIVETTRLESRSMRTRISFSSPHPFFRNDERQQRCAPLCTWSRMSKDGRRGHRALPSRHQPQCRLCALAPGVQGLVRAAAKSLRRPGPRSRNIEGPDSAERGRSRKPDTGRGRWGCRWESGPRHRQGG